MEEADYIAIGLKLIEKKLSWPENSFWATHHFQELSEQISQETKISISPKTLQRLSGKAKTYYKDEYSPQPQTKKALALFLGYKDWEEFKKQNTKTNSAKLDMVLAELPSPIIEKEKANVLPAPQKRKAGKFIPVILSLLLLVSIFLIYRYMEPKQAQADISVLRPKGIAPFLATFNINVSASPKDTVSIDFGDGTITALPPGNTSLSHQYLRASYYHANITCRDRILASTGVHATTQNWQGVIQYNSIPYLTDQLTHDGIMHISPEEVYAKKIIRNTEFWIHYSNVRDFNVDGDNFKMECRIKNSEKEGGIDCFDFYPIILGDKNIMMPQILRPGCGIWAKDVFSDIHLNSRTTDLSAFEQDLTDWRTFKLQVKNKKVSIYMDDKLLYTVSYTKPMGEIKSLNLNFKGCGSVDFVRIYNDSDKLVYSEDF